MRYLIVITLLALHTGCASYVTPGRAADLSAVGVTPEMRAGETESAMTATLAKRPLAQLPAGIAVVRLQAAGYQSYTSRGWGSGSYSIVTARDVEAESAIDRLGKLPMVRGVAPINRLLLPEKLDSDKELRQAAAQLHADFLLLYTFDTQFRKSDRAQPLTLVTLGLSPHQKAEVITTASAVLMDTRNGYVYGVAEASSRTTAVMAAWGSEDAIDDTRRKTEGEAFEKLTGEIERMWTGVVRGFGSGTGGTGGA